MLKVAELSGPLLDYWVARAEGYGFLVWEHERVMSYVFPGPPIVYAPSVDPQHAVRIVERERMTVGPVFYSNEWWAHGKDATRKQYGDSLCEAAMRCYVAEKFGPVSRTNAHASSIRITPDVISGHLARSETWRQSGVRRFSKRKRMPRHFFQLSGAELDYWVARAEGFYGGDLDIRPFWGCSYYDGTGLRSYSPSTHWDLAGEIIAREQISTVFENVYPDMPWHAFIAGVAGKSTPACEARGQTPLEAAMRAYIFKKLGPEVDQAAGDATTIGSSGRHATANHARCSDRHSG